MDSVFSVLQFAGVLLLVLVIFNIIIIVHELGHYWAARWRKLQVDKFQIWFGKPIWKKEINGVQWGLGSVPAGGFVALPQMAPMEVIEGTSGAGRDLALISPMDKIIVAFAGPLFSFGLAVVFALIVWVVGYPVGVQEDSTKIGFVAQDSPAEEAGLQIGDEIISVDGSEVKTFHGMVDSVTWHVVSSEGTIDFEVLRDGEEVTIPVSPRVLGDTSAKPWFKRWFTRPPLRKAGIGPWDDRIRVLFVMENSPAAEAGLKEGDLLRKVNGEVLPSSFFLEQVAEANLGQEIILTVENEEDGSTRQVSLIPRTPEKEGSSPEPVTLVGIPAYGSLDLKGDGFTRNEHPLPHVLIGQTFRIMYNTITQVANPNSDISLKHLSGPVGIINLYYRLFQNPEGWKLVLWFSVILNINLAIMNMMPFPVLDGGHITMALFEKLFRKPMDIRVQGYLTSAFAILLISFMLFVTVFDSGDVLKQNERYVPWEFAPEAESAEGT